MIFPIAERSAMQGRRRAFRNVPGSRSRSMVWSSWCRFPKKSEISNVLSWDFVKFVWSLLSRMAWRRGAHDGETSQWGHCAIGCSAPRASAIYGRPK